jgi:hypothetical protein
MLYRQHLVGLSHTRKPITEMRENQEAGIIKTIVFDVGDVLMKLDAMELCRMLTGNERDAHAIDQILFHHVNLQFMDTGTLTEHGALVIAHAHLLKRLWKAANTALADWDLYCTLISLRQTSWRRCS